MPCELMNFVIAFAELFSKPVFQRVKVLLVGAILTPASRTVTNALRVMGPQSGETFSKLSSGALARASGIVWRVQEFC
jgi:hypothetical protein